jgi:putative oxidoreductase
MSSHDQSPALDTHPKGRSRQQALRPASIMAWIAQILLGIAIAGGGAAKLSADPAMMDMFDDIGAGQWLRILVGVCEVAGGIGLLIPRVRALAALGLVILLLGAVFTNVAILSTNPLLPLIFAIVALAIVWTRRHELPRVARQL